jgi:hypothetical protein
MIMREELFKLIERNSVEIEESEKNGIIAHHVEVDDLIDDLEKLFAMPAVVSNCKLCETSMCKHRTYKEGKSVCKTNNNNCVYYC